MARKKLDKAGKALALNEVASVFFNVRGKILALDDGTLTDTQRVKLLAMEKLVHEANTFLCDLQASIWLSGCNGVDWDAD